MRTIVDTKKRTEQSFGSLLSYTLRQMGRIILLPNPYYKSVISLYFGTSDFMITHPSR